MLAKLARWLSGNVDSTLSAPPAPTHPTATIGGTARQMIGGTRTEVLLPGTGRGHFFEVVGESFYQDALTALWFDMKPTRELSVYLVSEPSNPHDPNAVAITSAAGATLGHMPREEAARYQQLVRQLEQRGERVVCAAKLVGGTASKPNLGVLLDIDGPTIVASKLGLAYSRVRK